MGCVRSLLKPLLLIKIYVKYASTNTKPAPVDCCMSAACLSFFVSFVVSSRCGQGAGIAWLHILIRRFQFVFSSWFFQRLMVCVTGNDKLFYR